MLKSIKFLLNDFFIGLKHTYRHTRTHTISNRPGSEEGASVDDSQVVG